MEEYITVKELSSMIKFSTQTIYNLIHQKVFVLGKHYVKPRPKKILFKASEIRAWVEGSSFPNDDIPSEEPAKRKTPAEDSADHPDHNTPKSQINI